MKVLENEQLSRYTTIKIGGTAKKMYVPETEEELIEAAAKTDQRYVIGGGSNLLIAEHEFESVLNVREFDKTIEHQLEGRYYVGASVRLQKLINTINKDGYGGLEYLYSVPGLIGGAIVMNAGNGKEWNNCISDHIVRVKVLHNGRIEWIEKKKCHFSHRNSLFKNNHEYIVLGAEFDFPKQDLETSKRLIKERLELCKRLQDSSKPNFGSTFMNYNKTIIRFAKRLKMGNKKGIHFSRKTGNWLVNEGNGTYREAIRQIKRIERVHKLFRKKCDREVILWD